MFDLPSPDRHLLNRADIRDWVRRNRTAASADSTEDAKAQTARSLVGLVEQLDEILESADAQHSSIAVDRLLSALRYEPVLRPDSPSFTSTARDLLSGVAGALVPLSLDSATREKAEQLSHATDELASSLLLERRREQTNEAEEAAAIGARRRADEEVERKLADADTLEWLERNRYRLSNSATEEESRALAAGILDVVDRLHGLLKDDPTPVADVARRRLAGGLRTTPTLPLGETGSTWRAQDLIQAIGTAIAPLGVARQDREDQADDLKALQAALLGLSQLVSLERLRQNAEESDRVVKLAKGAAGETASLGLAAHFGAQADRDEHAAKWLRGGVVLLLILIATGAASVAFFARPTVGLWQEELARLAIAIPLLALAYYLSRTEGHHREAGQRARDIEVRLMTVEAYVEALREEDAQSIRNALGKLIYGQLPEASGKVDTVGLDPERVAELVKVAMDKVKAP